MDISKHKLRLFLVFAALSAIFLLFRLKNIGHTLVWDEAWGILSIQAFLSNDLSNPFLWFYNFHPPLYFLLGQCLYPFKQGFDLRLEYLSLVISFLSFCVTLLLSVRLGGWKYAIAAGIFLVSMPAAIAYDTWIKGDVLASTLGYAAILLILNKRYLLSGICLGISVLAKENAFFFIITSFLLLSFSDESKKIRGLSILSVTILLMSGWWFLFFAPNPKTLFEFYFSSKEYGNMWAQSPSYYLQKLLYDLGPWHMSFFLIGVAAFLTQKIKKPETSLPLLIFSVVYVIISLFFSTKTPWLSISAIPAISMISASGFIFLMRLIKNMTLMKILSLLILTTTLLWGVDLSYNLYQTATYPNGWPGASASRKLAEHLNSKMSDSDKLMMTPFAYWKTPLCPVFTFYSKHMPVKLVDTDASADAILSEARDKKVSWIVVTDSAGEQKNKTFAASLKRLTNKDPDIAGWAYVWNITENKE